MNQIIFHIDVNSAYLSWSALKNLASGSEIDLRKIPAVVGGDRQLRHGIVLAKSIPAKAYGIYTSEPLVSALHKCPALVIEAPDHKLYSDRSAELMQLLSNITPDLEQISIDECFLDYSPIAGRYGSPTSAALKIKDMIFSQLGYTVNIGISDIKVLAKMASDFKKPDLVHTLFSFEIENKLWPLPVSSLYMCGTSSVKTLKNLGISNIGELAKTDPSILSSHLKSHGLLLWEYANGIDKTTVNHDTLQLKGIGNSITLQKDACTPEDAFPALLSLAESVATRLRDSNQLASMLSTEIKYNNFKSHSHQMTLNSPTSSTEIIFQCAKSLFLQMWDGTPIRLLGIRTSKLVSAHSPVQMSLFDMETDSHVPASAKHQKLDQALDTIRKKYGSDSVMRASLLKSGSNYKKH